MLVKCSFTNCDYFCQTWRSCSFQTCCAGWSSGSGRWRAFSQALQAWASSQSPAPNPASPVWPLAGPTTDLQVAHCSPCHVWSEGGKKTEERSGKLSEMVQFEIKISIKTNVKFKKITLLWTEIQKVFLQKKEKKKSYEIIKCKQWIKLTDMR